MKKITRNSKYGFTLLEVLLATVIMVIASTMIMKGFVAVMIFARNNRNFSGSGQRDSQLAIHNTLVNYSTSKNQMNTIAALADGSTSEVTLSFDNTNHPGYVASGVTLPSLYIDIETYTDPQAPVFDSANAYSIDGQALDSVTSSNNRFAFFYDFGDYMGSSNLGDHIPRWGYLFSLTPVTGYEPIYVDKNNNGLVGPDEEASFRNQEIIGYGHYGWYCFNASHVDEHGDPLSCRTGAGLTPHPGT